ncbi:hypothetical protein JIN84_17520 [Luteolibacter yonseiensis]|uniref:AsmA-like C-terminal domain-containing protein n=1 Tax=Luteolibacter yonseiensis TaxID=1144680 RepID=A0A934R7L6_9BACT|nr:hypothetical protein [Luteolibacter yonseiensis]MBK1817423.1 hypothetical protein [Luteolibacter yonseiensis]
MNLTDHARRVTSSRKGKWIVGCLAVAIIGWWAGNSLIASGLEKSLTSGAAKRGMLLEWKTSSWDPWRGLHLTGLRLSERADGGSAIAELENLNLDLPLGQLFAGSARETRWSVKDSNVVLRDTAGTVNLERVSLEIRASNGEIKVLSFKGGKEGLRTDLTGKIIFSRFRTSPSVHRALDLRPVRATLATLDVRRETGTFHVTGNFTVDLRNGERHWLANLAGTGRDLEWKGVRWTSANARATMSSTVSEIRYDLATANGFTQGNVSKAGWHDSPFTFKGELGDSKGHKDEYHGNHHNRVLTVQGLEGEADLFLLSQDIPALAPLRPRGVSFETFPMVDLRGLIFDFSSGTPRWSFDSLAVRTKENVTITADGKDLELRDLSVDATHDGDRLVVRKSTAGVFNGRVNLAGTYRDGGLRDARIGIESIKLAEIKQMIGTGKKRSGPGVLSADYRGDIDFRTKLADGKGTMRLENAPVLEVPLLDQVYDIFMELIPGVKRADEGTFDAGFRVRGKTVEVTDFEARGGSLTVTAVGTVDLDAHRVSGRARGKLVGLPGVVTSPLSRLLEMEVAGPYEDIRVKPLGPAKLASNTASGVVGVAVDTIEETGKVMGTVLAEGVKLPFRLFQQDEDDGKKAD